MRSQPRGDEASPARVPRLPAGHAAHDEVLGHMTIACNAKAFKEVVDLDADIHMFTEMLVRIGNLQ